MKTILWIGLTSTPEIFEQLAKKGYFHAPTYVAQRNIIEGIESVSGEIVNSINGFMMPTYPNGSEIITKGMAWSHIFGAEDISVTSVNLPYIDFAVRQTLMIKEGRKWARRHINDEKIVLIVYAASQPYIKTALEIKKIIPHAEINLIVPDLPLYMELNGSPIKQKIKTLMWKGLHELILQCDRYILFTKHMAKYLSLKEGSWMVMEGTVNVTDIQVSDISIQENEKIIIMYSGAIGMKYGVPELLQAFMQIKERNYELWFTGKGNADELVANACKEDDRIKAYGFLPSRQDVLKLQQKATMLINTRMPTEKASAYCFPSKIFEYLLSGKPTLSFKIPGIPDEYYDYLISMDNVSSEAIKEAILRVGAMSSEQRRKVGEKGREFVLREKNNQIQAKRICDFIGIETR
ncbi:glycosyltransferase [Enterococcus cecorum]|uniref:glycosyltransferase n=1 Tax=Enterococcus cecorum TaxID=44008 RepID=UPI000643762D|nr:glycosyltransferase [Enterococcus cecorum]KLO73078.1 hypothetical protein AA988_01225 [Enterococcus cecorum]CAI3403872.1 glycosyltransferase [Enterococcus cecorum]